METRNETPDLLIIRNEKGWYIEGQVPYVPEDRAPGWVCFEMSPTDTKADVTTHLLRLRLGVYEIQKLLEDF